MSRAGSGNGAGSELLEASHLRDLRDERVAGILAQLKQSTDRQERAIEELDDSVRRGLEQLGDRLCAELRASPSGAAAVATEPGSIAIPKQWLLWIVLLILGGDAAIPLITRATAPIQPAPIAVSPPLEMGD